MIENNTELPELETFSERLNWAIDRAKLNKSELARKVGVSPQAIQLLTTGGKGSRHAKQIAHALNVSAAWLVGLGDTSTAAPTQEAAPPSVLSEGLTALQLGVLDTLARLMRKGLLSDSQILGLLESVKPALEAESSKNESTAH